MLTLHVFIHDGVQNSVSHFGTGLSEKLHHVHC